MSYLRTLPGAVAFTLVSAHFIRRGEYGLALTAMLPIGLLLSRLAWSRRVLAGSLLFLTFFWLDNAASLIVLRRALGEPYAALAIILGGVSVFTLLSAMPLTGPRATAFFNRGSDSAIPSLMAFLLTGSLAAIVQVKVQRPMLLAERFLPGGGWAEILIMATYAAVITDRMLCGSTARWRRRIWHLFSIVFFLQLFLGLAGLDRLLMSGDLHVPVPAAIISGPIFRGEGLFMPVLFASTLILVGPAWCSHLCYFGALDQCLADIPRRTSAPPSWTRSLRPTTLLLAVLAPIALRLAGASPGLAAAVALGFGLVGVLTMLLISRRTGAMFHCAAVCPLGLLANLLGKLSPFRIRIADACDSCGACTPTCRYNALAPADLARKKVGLACSLCGDCIPRCKRGHLGYWLPRLDARRSRVIFIIIVVSVHAVFLGVARL